jgi:spore photoproduct lyase
MIFTEKAIDQSKSFFSSTDNPGTFGKVPLNSRYETDISLKVDLEAWKFYQKNIYYESDASITSLFKRGKILFPDSEYVEVESLKSFVKNNSFIIKNYNNRSGSLFAVKEKCDF